MNLNNGISFGNLRGKLSITFESYLYIRYVNIIIYKVVKISNHVNVNFIDHH